MCEQKETDGDESTEEVTKVKEAMAAANKTLNEAS
jgi:hypothetical protein